MSLTVVQSTDGYEYLIVFGGQARRPKRDGRVPNTSPFIGDFSNGYDNVITYGGQTYRQKRKGRTPSTSPSMQGVYTGVVNDGYALDAIGGQVIAQIDDYTANNEISEEEEE
jgi:hypothetical protein